MSKGYIFNEHLNFDDRVAIEGAVQAAGYDPVYGVPADVMLIDLDANIGVVGLPTAPEDVASVNSRTVAFAGAGIRVIGIWLCDEGDGEGGVPEGIGKYGTTVDISSTEITGTLKGQTDVWEEHGATPSPKPKTKRNKC
jgi:hypothetical protein